MVADVRPRVTADVRLRAMGAGIQRLAVTVVVDPLTVAARRTAAVDRTAVVVADMGGDIALGFFLA